MNKKNFKNQIIWRNESLNENRVWTLYCVNGADLAVRDGVEHLADFSRVIDFVFWTGERV